MGPWAPWGSLWRPLGTASVAWVVPGTKGRSSTTPWSWQWASSLFGQKPMEGGLWALEHRLEAHLPQPKKDCKGWKIGDYLLEITWLWHFVLGVTLDGTQDWFLALLRNHSLKCLGPILFARERTQVGCMQDKGSTCCIYLSLWPLIMTFREEDSTQSQKMDFLGPETIASRVLSLHMANSGLIPVPQHMVPGAP